MHPTVNHLIQLQELDLIRDEQKVAGSDEHLQGLDRSVRAMAKKLPKDIRNEYEKLNKRDHVVIVPVSNNVCAGCGLQLTVSLVQQVRMAKSIQTCPNCARMLYCSETAPRRIGKAPRRSAPRKVGIARFSAEGLMLPELKATDRDAAIAELGQCMAGAGFVDNVDNLVELALQRESVVSTAVGHGLAFPHVRGVEGGGLALALGLSHEGICFNGDGKPVHIIFFMAIPTAASAFYLKLLAGLTETFMKSDARKALLDASDAASLWKALTKVTRTRIK